VRIAVAGPSHTATWRLAAALARRNHEVLLVTNHPTHTDTSYSRDKQLSEIVIPYRRFRYCLSDFYRQERRQISQAFKQFQPDIISSHWCTEFSIAALATDFPAVVSVHDISSVVFRYRPSPYVAVRVLMQHLVLRSARHVTTNSAYTRRHIYERVRREVQIVPPIIPSANREFPDRPSDADEFLIGTIASDAAKLKNILNLLRAFRLLRNQGLKIRLELVGADFSPDSKFFADCCASDLVQGVSFLGPLSDDGTIERLRSWGLYVHPSLEESYGMTVAEALVNGVPVIGGSDSGAVPELLGHGRYGLLCNVRSIPSLASAIQSVMLDQDDYSKRARAGGAHLQPRVSPDAVASTYEELFKSVIAEEALSI